MGKKLVWSNLLRAKWLAVCIVAVAVGAIAQAVIDQHGGLHAVEVRVLQKASFLTEDHDLAHLVGTHWNTRDFMVRLQSLQAPQGSILLLGDSIAEGIWGQAFPVAGRRCTVVNGGYAGIGIHQLLDRTEAIFEEVKPRFVVVLVGINDAWPNADARAWSAAYDDLLQRIQTSGASPIVLTILPPESRFLASTKSAATVAAFNEQIKMVAEQHHAKVADVANDDAVKTPVVDSSGRSVPRTIDGIHPTGQFYHEIEVRWLFPAIAAAENERGEPCVTEN